MRSFGTLVAIRIIAVCGPGKQVRQNAAVVIGYFYLIGNARFDRQFFGVSPGTLSRSGSGFGA
jgi:hypothetical protein